LQTKMIDHAAALVRPGGTLVYSVCSLAPEEGIGVVGKFLAQHHEFVIDAPAALRESFAGLIDDDGYMKTRPDRGGLDGFFAARLMRHA
jgi:16S rRNA (cytosine967-C5)-methyltransferase